MSILFDFNDSLVIETMEVPWTDQTVTSIKAGTPLDETGAVSNDGDAIGLVAFDVPPAGQNMWGVINGSISSPTVTVKLVKGGYINLAEVEKSYGYALTDTCKSALTGIHFITDISSGGGGGGGADVVIRLNTDEDGDVDSITTIRTLDRETLLEKYANDPSSVSIFVYEENESHKITPRVSVLVCEPIDETLTDVYILAYDMIVVQAAAPINSVGIAFTDEGWALD